MTPNTARPPRREQHRRTQRVKRTLPAGKRVWMRRVQREPAPAVLENDPGAVRAAGPSAARAGSIRRANDSRTLGSSFLDIERHVIGVGHVRVAIGALHTVA